MTMTGTMTGTGVADRSERGTKRIDSVEGMKREVHIEAEAEASEGRNGNGCTCCVHFRLSATTAFHPRSEEHNV